MVSTMWVIPRGKLGTTPIQDRGWTPTDTCIKWTSGLSILNTDWPLRNPIHVFNAHSFWPDLQTAQTRWHSEWIEMHHLADTCHGAAPLPWLCQLDKITCQLAESSLIVSVCQVYDCKIHRCVYTWSVKFCIIVQIYCQGVVTLQAPCLLIDSC